MEEKIDFKNKSDIMVKSYAERGNYTALNELKDRFMSRASAYYPSMARIFNKFYSDDNLRAVMDNFVGVFSQIQNGFDVAELNRGADAFEYFGFVFSVLMKYETSGTNKAQKECNKLLNKLEGSGKQNSASWLVYYLALCDIVPELSPTLQEFLNARLNVFGEHKEESQNLAEIINSPLYNVAFLSEVLANNVEAVKLARAGAPKGKN